jgi:citrate lyase subunit beta/citryl-CoA lyase
MNKLNAKQLLTLPIGKHPDGNGLYLSIYKPKRGKWSFRYNLNKKAREMGLENALSILEKKTRVVASLVASEDMSVSLKSQRNKNSKILNYVRERFHVACCAANVISIDMPYTWADNDGVKMQAELARDIGMLSKSTVNANYREIINNIFSPTKEQSEKAKSHVEVFEKARKLGQGQVDFDGVRIEMPTYLNALEVIKRFNELKSFIAD